MSFLEVACVQCLLTREKHAFPLQTLKSATIPGFSRPLLLWDDATLSKYFCTLKNEVLPLEHFFSVLRDICICTRMPGQIRVGITSPTTIRQIKHFKSPI